MDASDGIPFESKRCAAKYDVQSELVKSFLLQINAKLPLPEGAGTPQQIDVVVSGGGMKGYFVVGAWSVLVTSYKEVFLRSKGGQGQVLELPVRSTCAVVWTPSGGAIPTGRQDE
jgi:hypothetical protein